MMYVLKTERNAQGKLVFSKEKHGKKVMFLAKDENGNVGVVDSDWVREHEYDIINLGVSGTTLYPVKLSKYFIKCEACGKPFPKDDAPGSYINAVICPHCYENGCWIGSEFYSVCAGCGDESDYCWIAHTELVDTVYDRPICKEMVKDLNMVYCENCNGYYHYENGNCPKCHSEED